MSKIKLNFEIIETEINKLIDLFKVNHRLDSRQINMGSCDVFAWRLYKALLEKNIEVELLSTYSTIKSEISKFLPYYDRLNEITCHHWIHYKGLHFDSLSPKGEIDFMNLNSFKNNQSELFLPFCKKHKILREYILPKYEETASLNPQNPKR